MIAMGVLPPGDPESPRAAARKPSRYDDSFRRYAVTRALEPDVRVADVAGELGVSASTLRRWVKAFGEATSQTSGGEDMGKAAGWAHVRGARDVDVVAAPDTADQAAAGGSVMAETPASTPSAPSSVAAAVLTASAVLPAAAVLGAAPGFAALPALSGAPVDVPAAGPVLTTAATPSGPDRAEQSDEHHASHVLAMLDAILEMFPHPGGLPLEADLADPGPAAHREVEAAADRIPLHPGDDIFPRLSTLLPAYRFPIILLGLLAALIVSTLVPHDYALRPVALSLHVLSLVVSFGAVLVIDWHGLLWLAGRRGLTESTRLAAGAGPLIWGGLAGLMATGAFLHPDLSSPLTVTKLGLVLAVAWNGAAMSALRRRMAQLPAYVKPADLPRRDWRLMMTATVISQVGWWGAILIGFVNSST